jgi:multidrug efflux pump subunit AcrB
MSCFSDVGDEPSRPHCPAQALTFIVMSILVGLFGGLTVLDMPTDVFPNITIPVTAVAWTYSGLRPQQVEGRITWKFERRLEPISKLLQ